MKKILAAIAGVLLLLLIALVLLFHTTPGRRRLAKIVRNQLQRRLTGPVEIGSLDGDLPRHIRLHDVVLHDADGQEAIRIAELELRLDLRSLFSRHIRIPLLRGGGISLHARTLANGRLNLAALLQPSTGESKTTVELPSVKLEGEASWEGRARGAVEAAGAVTLAPDETRLRVDQLEVAVAEPARGTLSASGQLRSGAELHFEDVVAELRTSVLARLQPRLEGAWRARVLAHGPLSRLEVESQVTPPHGQVHTYAELSLPRISFTSEGAAHGISARAEGFFDTKGDADVRFAARDPKLRADGHVVRKSGKLRLDADVHGRLAGLQLEAHAHLSDRLLLTVEGHGPKLSATLHAHGHLRQNAADVTIDQLAFAWRGRSVHNTAPARLTIGPQIAIDKLSLASGAQRLSLSGRWRRERDTLSLQLHAYLPALEELRLGLGGRAHLKLQISGTTQRPELALRLDGDRLSYRGLKQSRLHAQLDYHHRRLEAQLDAELGHSGSVKATAALPIDLPAILRKRRLPDSPIEAVLQLNGLALAALLPKTPIQAGTLSGTLSLSGKLRSPQLSAELSGNHLAAYGLHNVDASLRADYAGDQLQVSLQSDVQRAPLFSAHATARTLRDWRHAPFDAELAVPAYDLAGGAVSAVAEVHGSIDHPWGRLSARAENLHHGELRLLRANLEGDFDGHALSASLSAEQPDGGKLHADAAIPVDAAAPLSISISAVNVKLAAEQLGALQKLDGRLDGKLEVSGSRGAPNFNGALHLQKGALAIAGVPQLFQDISADVAAHGQTLELQKLALTSGDGKLQAKGHVELTGLSPKSLDLHADLSHLPVVQGPVGAWIDAELAIHGERSGDAFHGTVTLEKGTAHLPKLAGGRRLQPTGPLKEVVFTDEKARREAARRKAAGQTPRTTLLAARIPGPFHIRSPELMTDLDGDLKIEVVGPVARISGSIQSSGGWIDLLGRRYDIDRVRLGFGGGTGLDPDLDVRISRETSEAVIVVEVHGTASHPTLNFSSDPPIYSETQILGLIISGDPGQSRTSDRSLDQQVVGALSGVIVGRLKDQIAPALPIDVIKVDSGETGLASTRIELGKYITENIYVSYVHQFGELLIGTRRLNANEANVQWRVRRHFEINSRFGDAGVGALDFFWTFRY